MNDNSSQQAFIDNLLQQISSLTALMQSQQESAENMQKQMDALVKENTSLSQQVQHLLHLLYGRKSEKTASIIEERLQPTLFDFNVDTDYPEPDPQKAEEVQEVTVRRKKRKGQRADNFENLPHQKKVIEATEEEKICPWCNSLMTKIGEEKVGSRVVVTEPQIYIEDIYTETYVCENCKSGGESYLYKTKAEPQTLAKSFSSAESIAHVINERFVKGVPYYRQEREWKLWNVEISRRTLSNWVTLAAEQWLMPIYDRFHRILCSRGYCHADETPIDVFENDETKHVRKLKQRYMWVYSTIQQDECPIRLFDYGPGRGGQCPRDFLKDFEGVLITDAYAGYNQVEGVEHATCWAHARRKYVDSLPKDKKYLTPDLLPVQAIEKMKVIFKEEREVWKQPEPERQEYRQTVVGPLVNEFFSWVHEVSDPMPGSQKLQEALKYSMKHEMTLRAFLDDINISCTNSLAERTVRPFAIGRMNWLFSGSGRGAKACSIVYSIVETAKANGLAPYKYVLYLLKNLPKETEELTDKMLEKYLPWTPAVQRLCV